MKVLLIEDVDRLGTKGTVVEVKPGYARNYLLPKKKAILATESNLKHFNELKKREQIKEQRKVEKAKMLALKLQTLSLKTNLPMGEAGAFGAVTNSEIAELLKQAGFEIDKQLIALPQPIKEPGVYDIPIKLNSAVTATVKLWVGRKSND